jgi:phosphate transport system permease protein
LSTEIKNKNDSEASSLGSSTHYSSAKQDKLNITLMKTVASGVVLLLVLLVILLFKQAWPAISEFGIEFVTSTWWNPVEDEFGGLAFLYGTLLTSFLALLMAAPLSVAIALFIQEVLHTRAAKLLSLFVEMIASIPSIVFGLWGLFYLAPFVKDQLTPFLKSTLGFLPFFQGPSFGIGILTASLILAIMIIPTISSICQEVFKTISPLQKEAALALGSTRYEMIKLAILKPSFSGIMGAIVLGLGRALGETMAVAMVIGNQAIVSPSFFSPAATMASVIANEYAEADSDLHVSALCLVGILLFVVTLIVNGLARFIVWRYERKIGGGK